MVGGARLKISSHLSKSPVSVPQNVNEEGNEEGNVSLAHFVTVGFLFKICIQMYSLI